MITPYIYRYHLGNDAEKEDGKYVVYHRGEKMLIENRNVEFFNPDYLLTKEEFDEIVKGTKGIEDIKGRFSTLDLARQKAAEAWSTQTTSNIEMDSVLAEAFAKIIDDIWSKPWLGNATTKELLDEISARCGDLNYRTVD